LAYSKLRLFAGDRIIYTPVRSQWLKNSRLILMRLPNCTRVLKFWSDKCLLCLTFDVLVCVLENQVLYFHWM
jgi:hypothetical protein